MSDSVAHAEDAAYDAVGMEGLEGIGLFADAEELEGLAGDMTDGESRATAASPSILVRTTPVEAGGACENLQRS